ncbi:HlyC/CorC family transporter [candidate division WOR-3 bacterium]|nr:HlyC/CorC family transporter [candidate division WOR-3 bacterium]
MFYIIVLLLVCAFFTASEIAFVACDQIKLKLWIGRKVKGAKFALNFLREPDKLLITILVGNNLAIVSLGVIASKIWYTKLPELLITLFISLLILIFGEILPKVLASRVKEGFAIIFARPYVIIYWLFYPLIFIAHQSSIGILKLFGIRGLPTFHKFTRDELQIALKHALPSREQDILARTLNFGRKKVKDIMIPRSEIQAANENLEVPELRKIISNSGYSRIPVYQTTIDQVIGFVEAKSLLNAPHRTVRDAGIIKLCMFVSESRRIDSLLDEMREKRSFFAMVKDENKKTVGLVTVEDILEELFGEIYDEYDKIDSNK